MNEIRGRYKIKIGSKKLIQTLYTQLRIPEYGFFFKIKWNRSHRAFSYLVKVR